jgi:hypothetical protein
LRRDTFARVLTVFNTARPFLPFTAELVNGVRLISRHPEAMILRGDLVVFTDVDNTSEYLDATSVVRLVPLPIPPGAE